MLIKIIHSRYFAVASVLLRALGMMLIVLLFLHAETMSKVPVSLFGHHVDTENWDKGSVSALGTWAIFGSKQSSPLQQSQIWCNYREQRCIESQAVVADGKQLNANLDFHRIVRWDEQFVVFENTSPTCVDYSYTIDRRTKQVSGVRSIKATQVDNEQCRYVRNIAQLQLADGFAVWRELSESADHGMLRASLLIVILCWGVFRIWRIFTDSQY